MAERLYNSWETSKQEKMKLFEKLLQAKHKKSLKQALAMLNLKKPVQKPPIEKKIVKSAFYNSFREKDRNKENLLAGASNRTCRYQEKSLNEQNTSIFDKLHEDARYKQETQQQNEMIKQSQELKHCTFRPKVCSVTNIQEKDVYSRLAESDRSRKLQIYEAQKELNDTKNCTFQPEIQGKKSPLACNRSVGSDQEPAHVRLHRQAEIKDHARQNREITKKEKELDECTFAPLINTSQMKERSRSKGRIEELYQDYDRKSRALAKKTIQKEETESLKCTFKPKIISKRNQSIESVSEHDDIPVYEKLYNKNEQRKRLLEQKKQELLEEEKKMRQYYSKGPRHDQADFDRLYNAHKVYEQKKEVLSKKIMKVFD